jgi:hypothetical protein
MSVTARPWTVKIGVIFFPVPDNFLDRLVAQEMNDNRVKEEEKSLESRFSESTWCR